MLKRTCRLIVRNSQEFKPLSSEIASRLSFYLNCPNYSYSKVRVPSKSLSFQGKYTFASLPDHQKLTMPALSPTMKKGNIIKWNVKIGDKVEAGFALCEIETDKATLGFEMQEDGYVAQILLPEGSKDVEVGTLVAILVSDKKDVGSFSNYSASSSSTPSSSAPAQKETPKAAAPVTNVKSLPDHDKVLFPALSPTMKTGKILKWTKKVGDKITAGESIADVETDKATIDFVYQEDGFLAKILVPEGSEQINVGQAVCVVVDSKDAVKSFESVPADVFLTKAAPQAQAQAQPAPQPQPQVQAQPKQEAPKVEKKPEPKEESKQAQPPKKTEAKQQPVSGTAQYTDIPVTTVREVIAARLLESKTTIPHYYLKSEVTMDNIAKMREEWNKDAKSKISFNDIFIKAAAHACIDVPEVNSQWLGNKIRKFKNADISVAVDTGSGLITPIVFAANQKGLSQISTNMKELVEKAKKNSLKPEEFIGGTFCISNLGMFGIHQFSAVINPPQSCILAVGGTEKKVIKSGDKFVTVSVMNVTLSCDHRVVDGAVGAKWLQRFKHYLENPTSLLL